jgi:carnitine O-acetyltransferase
MFRNQLNLPKLPVPDLRTTLAKYLASVRPLVDDGQFKVTQQAVKEFESVGSLGQTLQQRLIDRYNDPNIINWMDELFVNNSYLNIRGPFRACFSYFFAYKDDKVFKTCTQRAAAITTAALEFKNLVINKELEPDYAGEPLCMDMYNHLFNSARIASFPIDTTMEYDPFLNTHIVVIRKNKFYFMDTVHNGLQLSTSELEIQFQSIIDHAGDKSGLAIGCFTTEDRDTWAKVGFSMNKTRLPNFNSSYSIEHHY